MEAIRSLRLIVIPIMVLLLTIPGAYAWNNVGVHPGVNELAYNAYVNQWMPYDQYLKQASLDGTVAKGEAWDPQDGTSWTSRIDPTIREKASGAGSYPADIPPTSRSWTCRSTISTTRSGTPPI